MTELDKRIEEESKRYSLVGIMGMASSKTIEDRVKFVIAGFKDGANFGISLERERSQKLVEALEFYSNFGIIYDPRTFDIFESANDDGSLTKLGERAKQALEEWERGE